MRPRGKIFPKKSGRGPSPRGGSADPYQDLDRVRKQARAVRGLLGVVAVGLPEGVWNYRRTSRLLIFRPRVLPPARKH